MSVSRLIILLFLSFMFIDIGIKPTAPHKGSVTRCLFCMHNFENESYQTHCSCVAEYEFARASGSIGPGQSQIPPLSGLSCVYGIPLSYWTAVDIESCACPQGHHLLWLWQHAEFSLCYSQVILHWRGYSRPKMNIGNNSSYSNMSIRS